MGQQQLLLLVLGIVIVGLAVVVGIQAFSENQKKANADALVNDAIRIASDAQAWMLKPTAFGGGSNSCASTCDWTNATFPQLGYPVSGSGYSNLNGSFTIDGSSTPTEVVIVATSAANGNQVTVTVTGTTPDLIDTQVDTDYAAASS
jgi:type II secretory pathway pseudopilin PulG